MTTTTTCRSVLGTARQCELPGGHDGDHRSGDLRWVRSERLPVWMQRSSFKRDLRGVA